MSNKLDEKLDRSLNNFKNIKTKMKADKQRENLKLK